MQHIGKLIQIKNNAGSLDELIELLTLRRIGHIGDVFRRWNWLNVARAASGRAVHRQCPVCVVGNLEDVGIIW